VTEGVDEQLGEHVGCTVLVRAAVTVTMRVGGHVLLRRPTSCPSQRSSGGWWR
jgi:uncharacterized membrane protein